MERALIAAGSVPVLERPEEVAPLVTELIAGECLVVLERRGGWLRVVAPGRAGGCSRPGTRSRGRRAQPRDADDRFERAPFRSRVGRACPRTRIEGVRPRALAGPAARLEDGGSVPARRATPTRRASSKAWRTTAGSSSCRAGASRWPCRSKETWDARRRPCRRRSKTSADSTPARMEGRRAGPAGAGCMNIPRFCMQETSWPCVGMCGYAWAA
jgi:hypothetical protein